MILQPTSTLHSQGTLSPLAPLLLALNSPISITPHRPRAHHSNSIHANSLASSYQRRQVVHSQASVLEKPPFQDVEAIRAIADIGFGHLDINADGAISHEELKTYLSRYQYTDDATRRIFQELDLDENGEVSLDELRSVLMEHCRSGDCETEFTSHELRAVQEADTIFSDIDVDFRGFISSAELDAYLLKQEYTAAALEDIFLHLARSDDGKISRQELRASFVKCVHLREAMAAVVKSLVKQKRWSPRQRERVAEKLAEVAGFSAVTA